MDWASEFRPRLWAVEGATGTGALPAQQLVAAGERVVDVPPKLAARVRLLDKVGTRPSATRPTGPRGGGGVLGVRALVAGSNRLLAVGDFSSVGSTNKLHSVAIFP